jgi:uridine kinase
MIYVNDMMNAEEARAFVHSCDKSFYNRLCDVCEQIVENDLSVIGLTGPSCSGKTTMANILTGRLEKNGKQVHVISLDDFFYEVDVLHRMSDDGEIDYDSPDTIDIETLTETVDAIFRYGEVQLPRFDFLTGKREKGEKICAGPDDRFIFEGIQVLYPEVSRLLSKYDSYKCIYIAPKSEICVGGRVFKPNHIRLLRRLVRDFNFRGASADFSLYLWESVRKNEEKNIFPHIDKCDYFIDSTLGYDINMLAPYLERILSMPHSGRGAISEAEYRQAADKILAEISDVVPMEKSYLSDGSLYREFI